MTDLIALALAIVLLLQLQRLRAVLGMAFAPLRARRIGNPRLPEAFADLYEQATPELLALGFGQPQWYLIDSVADAGMTAQPAVAWRQCDSGDVAWLFPPQSADRANSLLLYFVRRLADGRHALSQPYDSFAEIASTTQMPAQTIAGRDLAQQWQLHRDWCDSLGSADMAGTGDADLDWQADELHNQRSAALLAAGKLYRDSRGLLRPRPRFALQILAALWRRPKLPALEQPVPPARLAWLAQIAQRQTTRPVPRRVQAGLFGLSIVLFLLAGGWLWGLQFAVILFVVVGIHEFGHYLAMRAFGYRNVQMLALPLVGGVTIGHEAKPDAARRAWMSLMGPLPGIVIGWALVAYLLLSAEHGSALLNLLGANAGNAWLWQAAAVFLFVNYLNVLPVPPLDGAHVVQAMLPVGGARLGAVFIVVACVIGAALAIWAGFYLLAVLAAFQLVNARTRWQLAAVLQRLRGDPAVAPNQPEGLRRQRIFEVYDAVAGPAVAAPLRIGLGSEALRTLDIKPMRRGQRVAISSVYSFLLAGPVLLGGGWLYWQAQVAEAAAMAQSQSEQYQKRSQELAAQAKVLTLGQLVADLDRLNARGQGTAVKAAAAASEEALQLAQDRLGFVLPPDLLAFYRFANGNENLQLLPVEAITANPATEQIDLDSFAYEGKIHFYNGEGAVATLSPAQARSLLVIGQDADQTSVTLYDTAAAPLTAGIRFYRIDSEDGEAAAGLRQWLESSWMAAQILDEMSRSYDDKIAVQRERMADWTVSQLVDALHRPGWLERQLGSGRGWTGPATPDQIDAAAQRLGLAIPPELQQVYGRHNGIAPLTLLPLERWLPMAEVPAAAREDIVAGGGGSQIDGAILQQCIVIGAHEYNASFVPAELWCPQAAEHQRHVSLQHRLSWPSVTGLLREVVARQAVVSAP